MEMTSVSVILCIFKIHIVLLSV